MLRNAQSNGLPTQQSRMSTTSPPPVPMGVGMPAGQPALPETLR